MIETNRSTLHTTDNSLPRRAAVTHRYTVTQDSNNQVLPREQAARNKRRKVGHYLASIHQMAPPKGALLLIYHPERMKE